MIAERGAKFIKEDNYSSEPTIETPKDSSLSHR
jgi:hypothetical protein